MDSGTARKILHHAVSLRVLDHEDIAATGRSINDPVSILEALERQHLLSASVSDALEQLVEAETKAGVGGGDRVHTIMIGGGQEFDLDSATMAPDRDGPPAFDLDSATMAPERDGPPGAPVGGIDLDSATMAPERDAPAPPRDNLDAPTVAPGGEAPSAPLGGFDLDSATVAPDRDAPAGGAAFDLDSATIAPERETPGGPAAGSFDLDSATMAPEREGPAGLDLDSATIAPDRDRPRRSAPSQAAPVSAPAIDSGIVSEDVRRRIEQAAFGRTVLRRGLVDRKLLNTLFEQAFEESARLEDLLVERTGLTPPMAMEIYAELKEPLPVGGWLADVAGSGPGSGTPGSATASTHTLDANRARQSRKGIEGFPGEGGTFANYELIERLAEGGMGVVFRARETTLNRVVALKVMRGGALASKSRRQRFLREAEAVAALHHPNIVPIHQISEVSGYPFYTMDFVEGSVLDEHVQENQLAARRIARIMAKVGDAVHHFHLRGIIHRDLKPDNILVDKATDEPKIIDFGIAKKITSESEASWTVEGDVLGTPHYMPPEQAAGRVNEVDTRSDVYAMGAILYECLTGEAPFKGLPQARLVVAIQQDEPKSLRSQRPDLDRDLVAIVEKAMAKERERRYQSALDLSEDLDNYLELRPIQARPATFFYRARKMIRRRLPYVLAAAATLLVASAIGSYFAWQNRQLKQQVNERIAEASNQDLPADRRIELLNEAKILHPGHAENRGVESMVEGIRREKELEAKAEQERIKAEAEQARIKAEAKAKEAEIKAEAEKQALQEKLRREALEKAERARVEAAEKARAEREQRARALLAKAAQASALDAISDLSEALVMVPPEAAELRGEIEANKVGLCLQQAKAAVQNNQPGLAEYWLKEAGKLAAAESRQGELDAVAAALQELTSGRRTFELALEDLRQGELLLARDKFKKAQERGIPAAEVKEHLDAIADACTRRVEELVNEGRAQLSETPQAALGKARAALAYASDAQRDNVQAFVDECAEQVANTACLRAHELFRQPEGRREALVVLDRAVRALEGTPFLAPVKDQRDHRGQLLEESEAGLVYVPALADLGVSAFYVREAEVTNREFKAFVDAGGYGQPELFDPAARELLQDFVDATPGQPRPGPRTWQQGTYGDQGNAERPVRGITWYEARAYARWKSQQSKRAWRLPTVKEWEAAAGWDPATRRLRKYPWGKDFGQGGLVLPASLPNPVRSTDGDQSPLGLADAGGSVSEWVVDEAENARPALKGANFAFDDRVASSRARVTETGYPELSAMPNQLLSVVGFRLVVSVQ